MLQGFPILDPLEGFEEALNASPTPDGCAAWLFQLPSFSLLTRDGNMFTQEWVICMLGETVMGSIGAYNPLGWIEPSVLYDNLPKEDQLHFDLVWEQVQTEYNRLWNEFTFASINNSPEGFYRYDYKLFGPNAVIYFYSLSDATRGGIL